MSAIFGAISLKGEKLPDDLGERFKNQYIEKECKVEGYNIYNDTDVVLCCGMQCFTPESHYEILPYIDEEKGIYLTADCVLDNREELIRKLDIDGEKITDGEIIKTAYIKWGELFAKDFRGLFTIVLFDRKANKVLFICDQFVTRCMFYKLEKDVLYFSTLLFPLVKVLEGKQKLNEEWIRRTTKYDGPAIICEPIETAVKDVFKLEAGTVLAFENDKKIQIRYYDPLKNTKINRKISLKKSEEQVVEIMKNAVKNSIRTDGEVAAELSAGLDTNTVCSLAAGYLKEKGKKLYTYTSVPLREAGIKNKGAFFGDESEGALRLASKYPNIIASFVDTKERNYLKEAKRIVNIWELPCKSEQNAIWSDEIYKRAGKSGYKILLVGSTGNTTLSAGYVEQAFKYHISHFNLYEANNCLKLIKKLKVSRKRFLKYIYIEFKNIQTFEKMREDMYLLTAYAQIGEVETKESLIHGVITRDPTRNVELIDFCLTLPMRCFVNKDFDRRLVRAGMKDYIPKETRENMKTRGRQSIDNEYRINQVWEQLYSEIINSLNKVDTKKFLQDKDIDKCFENCRKNGVINSQMEVRRIVDSYSLSKFIECLEAV